MHPHGEYGTNDKTMLKLYIILIIRIGGKHEWTKVKRGRELLRNLNLV
jgi:hypothetical protein